MTRGVNKRYLTIAGVNKIGADVLCNSAGFRLGYVGFADNIEQGGFAMVHVAHDGNYRRTFLQFFRAVGFLF